MFMPEFLDREHPSTSPFVGLAPSRSAVFGVAASGRHLAAREPTRVSRTLMATMPVLLVGSLAISSLGLAPAPERAKADQRHKVNTFEPETTAATIDPADATTSLSPGELDTAAVAPARYTVLHGDTVSAIAGRYGLSTASVL